MSKFESGKTYTTRSVCDHNCIFSIQVERRTAKTIMAFVDGAKESQRLGITVHNGEEMVWPTGRYSMAPIIRAGE